MKDTGRFCRARPQGRQSSPADCLFVRAHSRGFPRGSVGVGLAASVGYLNTVWRIWPAKQEMQVRSLGQEDPLEKEMATYSSILAWETPWIEKADGLQSIGLQKSWTQLSN